DAWPQDHPIIADDRGRARLRAKPAPRALRAVRRPSRPCSSTRRVRRACPLSLTRHATHGPGDQLRPINQRNNALTTTVDPAGSAWNQYLDAWDDGLLPRDLKIARRAARQLQDVGVTVEVLFAEVAILPREAQPLVSGPVDA